MLQATMVQYQYMNSAIRSFTLMVFIFSTPSAFAGWMANADFTSCPRQYYPNLSGQEGPFDSESACNARVAQAKQGDKAVCIRYLCVNQAGAASSGSGASAAAGHELDGHISNAVSAGMNGQISGTDTVGLVSMGLLGNALLAPKAQETPEQTAARVESERLWAVQQAKANEQARLKEAAFQMEQDAESFAMMDLAAGEFQPHSASAPAPTPPAPPPPPPKPFEMSQAFTQGFEHASGCISQNSGAACAGSASPSCQADYKAGYDAGKKKYNLNMQEAFQEGKHAGAKGEKANGGASKNADGPCRIDWIQQYNRGHWAGRHPKSGKL